jgi:hypothetical protein
MAFGSVALVLMAVVGCTKMRDGTAAPDTKVAPAYRSSVSSSVSASSATSSIRESQRQQSSITRAIVNACDSFLGSANDAIDKMNAYIAVLNHNGNTGPTEGPAKDALNHSADTTASSIGDPMSQELRGALSGYVDAARDVARQIGPNPNQSQLNAAINRFNDRLSNARKVCRASV